ncbi:uncharacterized protein LOC126687952 [Mercurialis annua]|uniref:uncharacterized protein LOC126687952 n=1 Tax=Mercurialis annua TaxID=3986 RepID=UPI00215F1B1E|nr:uncharacterized protein LOC126687952 [Mercurialis annua]
MCESSSGNFLHSQLELETLPRNCWNRRLRIGEQDDLARLFLELQSVLITGHDDEACWQRAVPVFTPNLMSIQLQHLAGLSTPHLNRGIFIPSIWKHQIPPRIQFFMWLVAWDRISCNASLVARGILNPSLIGCSVCHFEESSVHILLHCSYAWKTWCFIYSKCGLLWVTPSSIDSFFIFWMDCSLPAYKDLWKLIWFFCVWELWKARNKRVFRGESTQIDALVHLVITRAVTFYSSFHSQFPYSGSDVYRCLDCFVKFN